MKIGAAFVFEPEHAVTASRGLYLCRKDLILYLGERAFGDDVTGVPRAFSSQGDCVILGNPFVAEPLV